MRTNVHQYMYSIQVVQGVKLINIQQRLSLINNVLHSLISRSEPYLVWLGYG